MLVETRAFRAKRLGSKLEIIEPSNFQQAVQMGEFELQQKIDGRINNFDLEGPLSGKMTAPYPAFFAVCEEFSAVQLSPHSRRAYANDLKDFFSYFLTLGPVGAHWIHKIDAKTIAQYRDYLLIERKLAKSSITRRLAVLKSFFKWAMAKGYIDKSPAELVRSFPQTQESKTSYLNAREIFLLLADFNEIPHMKLSRALARVVVETLLFLGLRRSEASSIRLGDFYFENNECLIAIRGKGDRLRLLPLPLRLAQSYSQWIHRVYPEAPELEFLENPHEWTRFFKAFKDRPLLVSTKALEFGKNLSTSEIAHIVRKAGHRAGLINRVSPHMLRATAITYALDKGATHRGVQQMAGWSSPLMISRYDKRLKDPKFSGVRFLDFAQNKKWDPQESEATEELKATLHAKI